MGIFGKLVRDWRSLRENQADSKSGHDAENKTVDADQVATDPVDAAKRKGVIHKRIILCCDGTWQTSATIRKNVPSNVTRLARSIAQTGKMNRNGGSNTSDDETCQQIVYYSAGIGTGDGVNIVEKARQATFGDGLASDVIKAYSFVVMNYSPHDEIFCFGFSRGAYTARAVAGLITDIGIIKPQELDDFPELYRIYRKHNDNDSLRFRQSPEYRKWILGVEKPQVLKAGGSDDNWSQVPHDLPPEYTRVIQVVGVFDTVGALGIPYMSWTKQLSNEIARRYQWLGVEEYGFHNPSLSRYIKHAFHALALDDHKTAFTPTLWRLPANDQKLRPLAAARERLAEILRRRIDGTEDGSIQDAWKALIEREMDDQLGDTQPELKQVWFPGSHTNIGGGNPGILMGAPFDCEQLALVSFTWMCDQISPYVDLNDETIQANGNGPDSEILSTLADREIESRRKLVEFSKQLQGMTFNSVIQVVRLVLARFGFLNVGADNHEWALGPIIWGKASIKGGLIYDLLYALWFGLFLRFFLKNRTPGRYSKLSGHQNAAGTTNEEIHPAVRYRMIHDKKYKPGALKALQKPESKRGGVYTWERKWGRPGPSLPEYKIKSEDRISRALASRSKLGKAFIKGL